PLLSLSATDTAPTAIYTLSLHDALPISRSGSRGHSPTQAPNGPAVPHPLDRPPLTPGAACRLPTDPHWEIDMRLTPGILVGSLLIGCAGDGTSPVSAPPPPTEAPSTSALVRLTTIDLARLDDYTRALPGYYLTPNVTRLDNASGRPITDA